MRDSKTNDKQTPERVWREYQSGAAYNDSLDFAGSEGLAATVERNEKFFIGDQWTGLRGVTDLDKPTVNFLGRVIGYFVSTITSSKIGANFKLFNTPKSPETEELIKIIHAQAMQAIESSDLNGMSKDFVRDASVCGDCAAHIYFDADAESGQAARGLVAVERIANTDVIFGNRRDFRAEKQPYIIIVSRFSAREIEALLGDEVQEDSGFYESDTARKDDSRLVTLLTKYYRKNGTIWRYQCTEKREISAERDMGYKRYPVGWMPWDFIRDSYHGQAAVTALIPNQITINKAYAMAAKQHRDMAFPKILYDMTKFPGGWSNRIGAVGVSGNVREAATLVNSGADIPGSTFTLIDSMLSNTRDMMGASDAALGNINPDNTSAIIAVQQATAVPLEMKARAFRQFIEGIVRSMLDIITVDYGVRQIVVSDDLGEERLVEFDFAALRDKVLSLDIDIGGTNYWSPETQAKQLENMYAHEIITRRSQFIENLPEGILENKARLLAEIKSEEEQENAMRQMQGGIAGAQTGAGAAGIDMPQL